MSKNATKRALAELHQILAEKMKEILCDGIKAVDDNGEIVMLTPGAPYLNVIRQFLKDNSVDSPSIGDEFEIAKRPLIDLPFTVSDEFGPTH